MKRLLASITIAFALLLPAVAIFTACTTSQQRVSYNSLYSVGKTVDSAYRSYLDAVVAGQVKTNDVPSISAQYNSFQQALQAAVVVVTLNSNAPAGLEITAQASELLQQIVEAKGKK